ncbi:hypothetical protein GDO81_000265 [Engystomops pustulosus]|uniref:Uncharacterized protein n=1 Tax=Engystomops pustulosus TaxID=76066 RepID=A0AAV7D4W4_ENGPU|nr:hypothetical protein GDO81_000265 [Engystomops pustulosus]
MTASLLLKLFIGITVLLIVCIPERFKTQEDISVDLSCVDPCMMDISYISRVTVTSLTCFLQENGNTTAIETVTAQNALLSSIRLGFYVNNSAISICIPQSRTHQLSQGKLVNVSLNIEEKYFYYSKVESNFVTLDSQEDKDLPAPFSLDIHISNHTGHNRTMQYQDPKDRHDFINVSLHFESPVPFYTRPLGIFWLILIALVFVCGLIFIVYKVKKEKKIAPLIDHNQKSNKKSENILSKPACHKNDHTCKQEAD